MKRNALISVGLLSIVVLVFVNAKKMSPLPKTQGYDVGSLASNFELKNVDGSMVSMTSYKDAKGFIVVFTCNTCPYAKMYEQRIDDLNKMYATKGYPVLAINPNDKEKQPGDSFEEMVKRADEKNYSFPYLWDETQEVTKNYGATRTPHVYILNKEKGGNRVVYIGAIDNNAKDASSANVKYVENALENLLAGEKIQTSTTKAIGCGIKWKSS